MAQVAPNSFIETYQGVKIYHNDEDGFFGENGCDSFGYHDALADICAEIDDYWTGTEHGELNGFFANPAA